MCLWNSQQAQLSCYFVTEHERDPLADSHNISNRWKNYFCQLLNVHGANCVRQTEMHTAEPLVIEPSYFEVKIAIEKLKSYKLSVLIKF